MATTPARLGKHAGKRTAPEPRHGLALAVCCALIALLGATPASAHYKQPPGDWEAAPAVVRVEVNLNFSVVFHPMGREGLRTFERAVPVGIATGAVIDPNGDVLTTQSVAYPPLEPARTTAINQAFQQAFRTRWPAAELGKRQRLDDDDLNEVLQDCYRGSGHCNVTRRPTRRHIVFNTEPARTVPVAPQRIGDDLAILHATGDREVTPTVALGSVLPQDAPYVALGWDKSGKLQHVKGQLSGGRLLPADRDKLASAFPSAGEGLVLVDPASKGTVLAVLTRGGDAPPAPVVPSKPVMGAGTQAKRGELDARVDQALGYFYGNHFTHAVTLLADVTDVLPDRELLSYLQTSKQKAGGPEDLSEAPMAAEGATSSSSAPWIPAAAGVTAAVLITGAVLLILRRRQRGTEGQDGPPPSGLVDDGLDDGEVPVAAERAHNLEPAPATVLTDRSGDERKARPAPGPAATILPEGGAAQYCPQCGVGLAVGDRFCFHCGTPAR